LLAQDLKAGGSAYRLDYRVTVFKQIFDGREDLLFVIDGENARSRSLG
jgi:hypothetical protein